MADERLTGADLFLRRLNAHGVDYVFANGGTDFAPIIEAYARGQAEGISLPRPIVMPHETAAVGMAYGYYLATGRPQVVILHTNVGLANALMGLINAAGERIPMLVCSGRTPITEHGMVGSRSAVIHWGQEMRDQAAMVREAVKWDYELRYPDQAADLVDRALSIAMSNPRGPVYLSLPREPLSMPCTEAVVNSSMPQPVRTAPAPDALQSAATLLAEAKTPLIINSTSGGFEAGFAAVTRFAEEFAFPMVEHAASRPAMPTNSAMHAGFDVSEDVNSADVILVLDSLVPWIPQRQKLKPGARVIQLGEDPLHSRFPVRGFPADVCLAGEASVALPLLSEVLRKKINAFDVAPRRTALTARNEERGAARKANVARGNSAPMSAAWVSACVSEALAGEGCVITELGANASFMEITRAGQFFGHPISGGLGGALTAALGLALAGAHTPVVATVGDGSYMFANPVACHQIAEALKLPLLTIVFNNGIWNAVKRSTLELFPDGAAARMNEMPITSLEPAPDYCKVAEASRAYTERVEAGDELPAALQRALKVIRDEGRQALIEVRVSS